MPVHEKFVLEDLPKSAVVNSTVYDANQEVDDLIITAVSKHLSTIVDDNPSDTNKPAQNSEVVEKKVDKSSETYNIQSDNRLSDFNLPDIEALKREEYERGVAETESKYKPLLENASVDTRLQILLEEKLSAILPSKSLDTEISKVSAAAISTIAKKLHLILPANFEEILSKGLIDKLKKFYKEGQITLKVHPDKYEFCKEVLQSDTIPDTFKSNFNLVQDNGIGLDDCKLEWQDTRLEYNKEQLSAEIDKIIEQLNTAS